MGCCNSDPDEIFAYNTFKVVRVKDRFLGLMRLFFMVLVFIYVVIKVMIIDHGYNAHDIPIGAVRVSVEMPKDPVNFADSPYCPQAPTPWPYPDERFHCELWDEHSARFPLEETNAIFMTTRIQVMNQVYYCGRENTPGSPYVESECWWPYRNTSLTYGFLAGISNYTLGIKHTFQSPVFAMKAPDNHQYAGASNNYDGYLVNREGEKIKPFLPNPANPDEPDVLAIGELMQAAGADFAAASVSPKNSQLYSGIVLMVLVTYKNEGGETTYTYRVERIPRADYKVFDIRWDSMDLRSNRTVIKRAGPKVLFIVTGDLSMFDFQTLLVQAVSAIGLLNIATLVVEFVMLNVLPLRRYYTKVKIEETEDFSDVRDQLKEQEKKKKARQDEINSALSNMRQTGVYTQEMTTPYRSLNDV